MSNKRENKPETDVTDSPNSCSLAMPMSYAAPVLLTRACACVHVMRQLKRSANMTDGAGELLMRLCKAAAGGAASPVMCVTCPGGVPTSSHSLGKYIKHDCFSRLWGSELGFFFSFLLSAHPPVGFIFFPPTDMKTLVAFGLFMTCSC